MLQRAVNSVLEQTYRPIELIIVNDGSTDSTGELADRLAQNEPEIVRVLHIENSGPGLAREAGRLVAKGDFIQYLDSDDWLLPNKFHDQISVLDDVSEADIVYGITRLVDQEGVILKEPSKDTGVKRDFLFPALLVDRWWHTSTPIYSKRISDLAGAWPDKRPEDWDLESRMGAHRPKLAYVNKAVSCHLEHSIPGRVSQGRYNEYLVDEAWFLPRLYARAVDAGVSMENDEMKHFSKWAHMRSRHLAAIGEKSLAKEIFSLSLKASDNYSFAHKVTRLFTVVIGWSAYGKLSRVLEKLM